MVYDLTLKQTMSRINSILKRFHNIGLAYELRKAIATFLLEQADLTPQTRLSAIEILFKGVVDLNV